MTWNNPLPIVPTKAKAGKRIKPEQLAGDTEHSQQVALFAWAADSVGTYPALAYMFAIPNGGLRDVRTATNLKAEGVKSGVPDIFLPFAIQYDYEQAIYHGCFIEMKIEKYRNHKNGGCSEAQLDFIEWIANSNYYVKVCYGWEEARDTLINYLEGKL
jgi:hypothetical protein